MRNVFGLTLLLPVLGCGPVMPGATLPPDAMAGAGDPLRAAIYSSSYAFNNPAGLADPAVAARASAQVEYLAANLPQDGRYSFTPTLPGQLSAARNELRATLGVAPGAPPQAVVEGLYGASGPLARRDMAGAAAALPPATFPNSRGTVARLAALGPLPFTAAATAQAEREQLRFEQDRQNDNSGGPGNSRP